MKTKLLLSMLCALFLQLALAESEPNDNPGQANTLVLGVNQTGILSGTDVDDWFVIDVTQAGTLTLSFIKTGGGQGNFYLKDGEKAGNPVINSYWITYSESPPDGWKLSQPVLAGKYYIHLNKADAQINYTLSATLAVPAFGEDVEPNDTSATATLLPIGGTVGGTLRYYHAGTDYDLQDWYKVVIPKGGYLNLTIQKKKGGQAWFYFRESPDAGKPIVKDWYWTYEETGTSGWQWVFPVQAGTFYIQIKNDAGSPLDYQIHAELIPPAFPEDAEPNDTSTTALPMPANGTVSGTIRYYTAGKGFDWEDWYKIVVPQGGILNFTVRKKKGGQAHMYLRDNPDASKSFLSDWYWPYSEPDTNGWKWSFPVQAGTFFVQIRNDGNDPLDYQIQSALTPPAFAEDAEPNDTSTTALLIQPDGVFTGNLAYFRPGKGSDVQDWYKFDVPRRGIMNLTIYKKSAGQAWFRVRDTSDATRPPIYQNYISYSETPPEGWKWSLPIPRAGTYWVQLQSDDNVVVVYKIATEYIAAPQAGFVAEKTTSTFAFENRSTGKQNQYKWDFDDGTPRSTAVNPLHEYKLPANYNVCLIATNPGGADTFCQIQILPGLAGIRPTAAGNLGQVSVQIFGGGLDTNFQAKIMLGTTLLAQSTQTFFYGKSGIQVQFDLKGKAVGVYDIVVAKPGGPSYSLPGSFKIESGKPANIWANISGRNRILFNTPTTYTLNYGNYGNTDARMVPIWLAVSRDPGLDVQFPGARFLEADTTGEALPSEGLYEDLNALFGQPGAWRMYPILIPLVEAGSSHAINIKIKTGGNLKIHVWTEKPWYQSPLNEDKLECVGDVIAESPDSLGIKNKVDCAKVMIGLAFNSIMDSYFSDLRRNPFAEKPDLLAWLPKILRFGAKVCGVTDKKDRAEIGNWITEILINNWLSELPNPNSSAQPTGNSCPTEFAPQNPTATALTAVSSLDPNEKVGPQGFGNRKYIAPRAAFPYAIYFENKSTASAPAHTVVVTDTLDWSKFDLNTFGFGPITVGDSILRLPTGERRVLADVPGYIPGKVTLRVLANVDLATGEVRWVFRSLDPVTLEDIEDPDVGFLPPNILSREGQGSVTFSVNLKKPLADGQELRNRANIFFDANDPILTNEHFVTGDALPPESAVLPLPDTIHRSQFPVSWSGSDDGSGVQFYNLYFSVNGGPDSLWLVRTTATTAVFTGKPGNRYAFYSIAADNVGNLEAAPTLPDAEISVLVATDDPEYKTGISVFPNPAHTRVMVIFDQPARGEFRIMHPSGTVVYRGQTESGLRQLAIPVGGIAPGLYFWKWTDAVGRAFETGRLVVAH